MAQGLTLAASQSMPTSKGANLVAAESVESSTSVLGQTTARSVLLWSFLHFLLRPAPHSLLHQVQSCAHSVLDPVSHPACTVRIVLTCYALWSCQTTAKSAKDLICVYILAA